MSMKRIVVLISGGGSNLQSLLDECANGSINGQIVAVISNRPAVMGLQRAVKAGVDALTIDHKAFDNRENFESELSQCINRYQPDIVVLAGFMRILTESFVTQFLGKMVNIHPSLLPKYPGLDTHKRAIEACDELAGATVHFVTPELDGGPLIIQGAVPIQTNDSEMDVSKRVLACEHKLYPEALRWLCDDRLTYAEGKAIFDGKVLQVPARLSDT